MRGRSCGPTRGSRSGSSRQLLAPTPPHRFRIFWSSSPSLNQQQIGPNSWFCLGIGSQSRKAMVWVRPRPRDMGVADGHFTHRYRSCCSKSTVKYVEFVRIKLERAVDRFSILHVHPPPDFWKTFFTPKLHQVFVLLVISTSNWGIFMPSSTPFPREFDSALELSGHVLPRT